MTTAAVASVVVIDDDTIIREGLPVLLRQHRIVAQYASVEAMLAECPKADIVLLDLDLRGASETGVIGELEAELALLGLRQEDVGLSPADLAAQRASDPLIGVSAVRAVRAAGYRVLIYTNLRNRVVLASCLAAGAAGVVHKVDSIESTNQAIEDALAGKVVLTGSLVGLAQVVERRGDIPQLGARQRQVLDRRARGDTYRRISRNLGISEKTAQEYMEGVNEKFARSLRRYSPADLQRVLGLGPDDFTGSEDLLRPG